VITRERPERKTIAFTPCVDGGDVDISINSDRHAIVETRPGTISGSLTGSSESILILG
jgi:hypothetical protein